MASDGGDDAGVCESWGGGDDGVGDEVVNTRMLFLLHLLLRAILEGPLDNVGLVRDTLEVTALFKLCPEVVEVLEFDEVPDLGKRGGDDGRLGD